MLACSEAQKIFGINPRTGLSNESKTGDNESGHKRFYVFDPDCAFAKISFDNRKDSKYRMIISILTI